MNRRGQGSISMNTIIAAIVAIIVLLLIVIFLTGGLGNVFGKIRDVFTGGIAGTDIELAKANCQNYCEIAKGKTTRDELKNTAYCTREVNIDYSPKDNQITANEQNLHCWQDPINIDCAVTLSDGVISSDGLWASACGVSSTTPTTIR